MYTLQFIEIYNIAVAQYCKLMVPYGITNLVYFFPGLLKRQNIIFLKYNFLHYNMFRSTPHQIAPWTEAPPQSPGPWSKHFTFAQNKTKSKLKILPPQGFSLAPFAPRSSTLAHLTASPAPLHPTSSAATGAGSTGTHLHSAHTAPPGVVRSQKCTSAPPLPQ